LEAFLTDHLREPVVAAVEEQDHAVVVRLVGELDLYNAGELRETLDDVCARRPGRVVVDLSEVTFIDSTGLGVLVEARSKLPDRKTFVLSQPQPETRRALEISGLSRHMPIFDGVEQALTARL
jgi:anti-sigma B factor antagonist